MIFSALHPKPYAFNLANIRSCSKQSKAFDRSVNKAPETPLLSNVCFHFSSIRIRHRCELKCFLNPHWYFDKMLSRKVCSCCRISRSIIFDIAGKMLTGL